jgi:hypothetical protein
MALLGVRPTDKCETKAQQILPASMCWWLELQANAALEIDVVRSFEQKPGTESSTAGLSEILWLSPWSSNM